MKSIVFLFISLLIQSARSQISMTNPSADVAELGGGGAFAEPDPVSSTDVSWTTTLDVDIGTVTYGWLELKRRMYNSKIVGPTITLKQGDTLQLTLNNLLSDNQDTNRPLNSQRYPNTTNLHTHGLHLPGEEPGDSVLVHVEPGTSYNYEYDIHADQPAGTYWYHAHVHGSTAFQVQGGLSGMLIIEDPTGTMPTELAAVSCPTNCDKDIQMLFQPILMYEGNRGYADLQDGIGDYATFKHDQYVLESDGTTTLDTWLEENLNLFTTNGQLQPVLAMTTGQMYRFRLVNAGGSDTLELYIVNAANTAACTIREIAIDGVYLDAPRALHEGQSFLVPSAKVDWLVKCDTAGTFFIKSFANPDHRLSIGGFTRYDGTLVQLTVSGAAVDPAQDFPTTLPTKPSFLTDLSAKTEDEIGGRFVVELNPSTHLNRELWSAGTYYRYKMTVGTIQEWFLTNSDTGTSHPVHIHVNHFQITSWLPYTGPYGDGVGQNWELFDLTAQTSCEYQRNGFTAARKRRSVEEEGEEVLSRVRRQGPGGGGGDGGNNQFEFLGHDTRYAASAGDTLGYARVRDWRDVVLVPPLANLSVRFMAHEHLGDVIIHCHILAHEDDGMMMIVEVVAEGADTTANTASGGAYPGTCNACDRYPFNNPETLGTCTDAGNGGTGMHSLVGDALMILLLVQALWHRFLHLQN